ncbi:MAG: hypothetical protein GYB31_02115 [Bacteroidetes bacterium]|nr:hypothetical protein [Bacteroidota bacterium]
MQSNILQKLQQLFGKKTEGPDLSDRNIILTGVPRSGTTLTCFLLTEIPNSVALNEPVRIGRLRTKENIIEGIGTFFQENRHTLLTEKTAIARATKKGITDNNFADGKGRKTIAKKQRVTIDKDLNPDFYLGIKHNATFTILMDELRAIYPFFAQIRNPIPVLGSWNSLDVPASRGEVRASEWLNTKLHKELEAMDDLYEKQLHILQWYFEQYTKLPESSIIRYEDLIKTNGRSLQTVVPEAANLEYPLESKNRSKLYDSDIMKRLGEKLLSRDHACWQFYDRSEVEAMLP